MFRSISEKRGGGIRDSRTVRTAESKRRLVPMLESLEPRLLLYATSGGAWPHPELVTVSFMPDGTDIAGQPSALVGALNARFAQATWQKEIVRGLQSYAANANVNFSVTTDDGSPFGSAGGSGTDNNMQGDSNFGDVRIGGFNLGTPLGLGMLPPNINTDTTAGDFFLNSTVAWNIGSTTDLYTVAAHEAGHAIGLDHSLISTAVMYATYNGVKSNLTSDDIAGIQSVLSYGARLPDSFDLPTSNDTKNSAAVITSYIDANKQVSLSGLDITTTSDVDWYKITIPSGSAGTMVVKVQSTGLSLLAPKFTLYKGSTNKGTVTGDYNTTVSQTETISSGQNWFVKVEGADTTVFGTGAYALQINMGSATQNPVASPNTATAATSGGSGIGANNTIDTSDGLMPQDSVATASGMATSDHAIVVTAHGFGDLSARHSTSESHRVSQSDDLLSAPISAIHHATVDQSVPVVIVTMPVSPATHEDNNSVSALDQLLEAGLGADLALAAAGDAASE